MKKIFQILTIMLLGILTFQGPTANAQCSGGVLWQSGLTPTTTWQSVTGQWAGEYSTFNVVAGTTYEWSTCSADGSNVTYDSQLTLINNSTLTSLAYSDDFCGLQSKITWNATFTGVVRVLLNQYNCLTNNTSSTIMYRALSAGCSVTGTLISSIPVTNQAVVCTGSNTLSSANVLNPSGCGGSTSYLGGWEGIYRYTPAATGSYTISYSGQSWSAIWVYAGCPTSGGTCVGYTASSTTSKSLNVNLTAGTQYYFWFDTWPSPTSPCPGTFSLSLNTCNVGTVISPSSIPITNQAVSCTATNFYTSGNVVSTACGSTSYLGGADGIYRFTPTVTQPYTIAYSGQTWSAIWVFQGCPTTAGSTCIGYVGNSSSSKNLTVNMTAGVSYWFWFDTWPTPNSPCPGTFSLTGAINPCTLGTVINPASLPISNQTLTCSAFNEYSTSNVLNPSACGGSTLYLGGQDAIYRFTPSITGNYNINVTGQSYTAIWVYQGCPTSGGTCVGYVGNSSTSKTLTVPLTAGIQYTFWFDTWPSPNSPCPGTFSLSLALPPPSNDQCTGVTPVNLSPNSTVTFTGNSQGATTTNDGAFTSYPTVWHAFTLTQCADVTVSYCNNSPVLGNIWLNLSSVCPSPAGSVTYSSYQQNCGSNTNYTVTFLQLPAGTYYLPVLAESNVAGFITTPGPYNVQVIAGNACPPPPVNDLCANALPLPCDGSVTGNTTQATSETGLPSCGNYNKGVWYTITSPGSGTMTLSLCTSAFDTYLSVFTGSSCGALTCVTSNDDYCGVQSQVSFAATQGTTYYVLVAGWSATSFGNFTLTSTCPPPCLSQPVGGTIAGPSSGCTNQNLTYNLSGGNGAIQWQGATAPAGPYADLSGQTSASLTYSVSTGGTYYLRAKRSSPGCIDDYSNVLTVNIVNGVNAFSVTSSATNVCPGAPLQLGMTSSGAANFYSFSTTTGVALEDMTGASTIISSFTDDGGSGPQTIPFAFTINGVNYTQFNASSNGLLNFGASGNSGFTNTFGNETYYPALLTPWEDLHTGDNGNVRTKVVGPAGSRKYIIEWNVRLFSGDPTSTFTKTWQVWLFEGSNVIQFVYGNNTGSNFGSASFGFSTSTTQILHVNTGTHTASNVLPGDNNQTAWPGAGRSYIFSPPAPTGTIVWTSLNGFPASGVGPHTANPTANDTYTVTVTAPNGCTSAGTASVIVDPAPVPSASANAPAVCEGSQIDLYALDGITYTYSGPGFGPITLPGDPFNGSSINVTYNALPGVHDGNYNITVTNSYGCSTTETVYVGVNPLPQLTIDNIVPESCPGAMDGSFTLSSTGTPDFTYYLTNGSQNGGGIFEFLGTGDYYAYVSDANCFNYSTIQVNVPLVPNVPPTLTCPGDENVNNDPGVCGAVVNYSDPVAFDTCPNGMSTVIQTNGLPSGSVFPVGTTVNSFVVYDAEGDSATCSFSVTVADVEDPVITNVPANFSSCNPVSWTPPTVTDNCSSGSSLVLTSNYQPGDMFPFGTTEVIYTATDAYNNQTTVSFFVTRLEDSYAATGVSSNRDYNNICIGENITLTLSGGSLGEAAQWVWYAGGCGTGTPVGTGTSITVAPTVTTTYYVRAEGFCNTTACVQLTVIVSTAPPAAAPTFTSVPSYGAPGVTNTVTVAPVSGATYYRWSTNNGQINGVLFNGNISPWQTTIPSVDVTYVLPQQNYQIRVLAGNACGRTNTANNHVRGTVAATTCINGPTNVCPSSTYSYSACPIPSQSGNSAVSYQWSLSPASAGTITGNGNINVTVTLNPGFTSAQLCVSGVSSFGLAGAAYCITLNSAAPAPASVSGAALVCADGTTLVTYTAAPVASAVSYSWSVPAGASIVGAANGTSIDVIFGNSFTGGNVCVAAVTAACGTSTPTCMSVAANVVGDPGVIVGPSTGVCGESNVSYSLSNGGANTYNWTLPAGASFNSPATGSAISVNFGAGFTSGYITVEAVFTCGSVIKDIFVNGAPAMPTVTPATICANTTVTYVASSTGATSYNWSVFGANTYSVNFSSEEMTAEWGASNNSFSVTATNACGTSDPFVLAQNCRLATAGNMGQVNVFPNPTTGLIAVEFTAETAAQYSITVTDLSGRSVLVTDLKAVTGTNHTVIDLSFVNKGLYMLYLRDASGNASVTRVAVE